MICKNGVNNKHVDTYNEWVLLCTILWSTNDHTNNTSSFI